MTSRPTDSQRVVITGIGPVAHAGIGVGAFWESLLEPPRAPIERVLHVDLAKVETFHIASMPPGHPAIDRHQPFLDANEFSGYRDLAYALAAIDLAIDDASLGYDREDNRIGVIQAFEAPGMERAIAEMFQRCADMPQSDQPPCLYEPLAPFFYNSQPFLYVHAVSKAFQFHGFSTSIHNACSTGAFAIEMAAQQIRAGHADTMIVVGGEAFDTAVRIEWFRRLDLYNKGGAMYPFHAGGSGFFVGEGAAALVLESMEAADARGATTYAEYVGGAFAQQSWKHALPDVRSKRLRDVIKTAMSRHNVAAGDVDLVIPHGASTTISDGYEAVCLDESLAGASTDAVATALKPYVGHTLATSNLIETAGALLAMKHGTIPATPHPSNPACTPLPIPLVTEPTTRDVNVFMKLATGFTGHDGATIFRKIEL